MDFRYLVRIWTGSDRVQAGALLSLVKGPPDSRQLDTGQCQEIAEREIGSVHSPNRIQAWSRYDNFMFLISNSKTEST